MSFRILAHLGLIQRVRTPVFTRSIHYSTVLFNEPTNSVFSDITELDESKAPKRKNDFSESLQTMGADENFDKDKVVLANDTTLHEFIGHKPTSAVNKLLTPLKKQLYEANVKQNGFFKNKQEITLNGEKYKLKLSKEETDILEPSLYIKSYRIKSSMKKATIFLRFINGMNVNEAITQSQFQRKRIGKEIAEILQDRIKDAPQLNLDPNDLYISQIWCGSDGFWSKRLDPKARGKTGVIHHPYIHVRAILKTSMTKKRLAWEKEQKELRQKPKYQLPNEKLRFKLDGLYKW